MTERHLNLQPWGYSFGCQRARASRALDIASVRATFEAQAALWNEFVEIEADNRVRYRAIIQDGDAESAAATALAAEISARADAMAALPRAQRDLEALARLRAEAKAAKADAREVRKRARERLREPLDALELDRRAAVKRAVRDSGLWWCHSEVIVERYQVARMRAMKVGAELRPARDRASFGALRVRWQNGIPAAKLLAGGDTLAAMAISPRQRSGKVRADLTICIDSAGRDKDYVTVPVVFSRHLPDGAIVRSISLFRRRCGGDLRWHGAVTVQQPVIDTPIASGPSIHLQMDWLKDEDEFIESMSHVRALQSDIDLRAKREAERVTDVVVPARVTFGVVCQLAAQSPQCQEIVRSIKGPHGKWREMHSLRQKAIRRRDHRYRMIAKDLCLSNAAITAEKPAGLALASKGGDRPAWGRFCQILEQAGRRHGCAVDFVITKAGKAEGNQADR